MSSNASTSNQLKWQHVFLFIKRKPWDSLNGYRHGCPFSFFIILHCPLILSQPFVPVSFSNLWDLVPVRPTSIPPKNLVLTDQLLLYLSLSFIIPASLPAAPHHESCTDIQWTFLCRRLFPFACPLCSLSFRNTSSESGNSLTLSSNRAEQERHSQLPLSPLLLVLCLRLNYGYVASYFWHSYDVLTINTCHLPFDRFVCPFIPHGVSGNFAGLGCHQIWGTSAETATLQKHCLALRVQKTNFINLVTHLRWLMSFVTDCHLWAAP